MRIGELWSGFINENPVMTRRLCEARIPEVWPGVAGTAMASLTTSLTMRNGILTVTVSSSVARHELFMKRAQLKDMLNTALGMAVVSNVIVK